MSGGFDYPPLRRFKMVLQNMFCCKNDAIAFYNELTESNAKQFFINKENRYPLSKSVQANL